MTIFTPCLYGLLCLHSRVLIFTSYKKNQSHPITFHHIVSHFKLIFSLKPMFTNIVTVNMLVVRASEYGLGGETRRHTWPVTVSAQTLISPYLKSELLCQSQRKAGSASSIALLREGGLSSVESFSFGCPQFFLIPSTLFFLIPHKGYVNNLSISITCQ